MENVNTWTEEERQIFLRKAEMTEEILFLARQNKEETVILDVNFKTGEYQKFDKSNMKSFKPRKKMFSKQTRNKKAA